VELIVDKTGPKQKNEHRRRRRKKEDIYNKDQKKKDLKVNNMTYKTKTGNSSSKFAPTFPVCS